MNYSGYGFIPETAQCLAAAEQSMMKNFSISPLLNELVRIRCSQLNGCYVCVDTRTGMTKEKGETTERLMAIAVWREAGDIFNEQERAGLLWAEALTNANIEAVSTDVIRKVKPHFTPQELSELTACISIMNTWNRQTLAMGALEEYMRSGAAPSAPEAPAAQDDDDEL